MYNCVCGQRGLSVRWTRVSSAKTVVRRRGVCVSKRSVRHFLKIAERTEHDYRRT